MTLQRFLSCPKCGRKEFWISMTTGGYPAEMTLHCIECNHRDQRFWISEDWRKLASLETFEMPETLDDEDDDDDYDDDDKPQPRKRVKL